MNLCKMLSTGGVGFYYCTIHARYRSVFVKLIPDQISFQAFGSREVYEGVLSWVGYDLESRKKHFTELFQLVKLHLLPASYLEEVVADQELVKESHECKDYFQKELLYRLKLPTSVQSSNEASSPPSASRLVEVTLEPPKNLTNEDTPKGTKTSALNEPPPKQNDPKKKNKAKPASSQKGSNASQQSQENGSLLRETPGPSRAPKPSPSHQSNDVLFSKELVKILRHGKYSDIALDNGWLYYCVINSD